LPSFTDKVSPVVVDKEPEHAIVGDLERPLVSVRERIAVTLHARRVVEFIDGHESMFSGTRQLKSRQHMAVSDVLDCVSQHRDLLLMSLIDYLYPATP
jgi:hypothetical protein